MPAMHEVDYKVFGDDMQFVEVELDPGEATVAEAGGMMYMEDGIEMETVFGDGSQQQSGFVGALIGAGKRLLVGESLFMTVFLNKSSQKKRVAFGAPYPGKIVPVHLAEIGGELIAQKDSFLAAAKGVSIGIAFQRRLGVGLFGGEGFIMERLQGNGWAFVHAGGMLTEKTLTTTFSSSAKSSRRCSAVKACSSLPFAVPAVFGFNPCLLAGLPAALWPLLRAWDAAAVKKGPSLESSATSLMEIIRSGFLS